MDRLRVATVVGTRPEIIRLSRVMAALDGHTDHVLVHTGQNYDYELNRIFFDDLGIRPPDRYLEAALERGRRDEHHQRVVEGRSALLQEVRRVTFLTDHRREAVHVIADRQPHGATRERVRGVRSTER